MTPFHEERVNILVPNFLKKLFRMSEGVNCTRNKKENAKNKLTIALRLDQQSHHPKCKTRRVRVLPCTRLDSFCILLGVPFSIWRSGVFGAG